ncbi:MAG: M48 family metalloprotease [Deltaproteobacteria bacterium]|nr:MAG: M48 family metalloprotease [Deltaproteobacteria bacterium]
MMARHRWKILVFVVIFMTSAGWSTGKARADLSIEDEKRLGEKFLQAVLQQLKLIEDPEVVGYVNRVGQAIVDKLEVHNFPYHFYVVDSSALNAFAAPAGHVFMNRGLIEIMEDEGELAAILAHEIAHVQSRHIAQRMARAQKLNVAALGGLLAGIFLGGEAGAAIIAGSQAGATSAMLNYSRQDEEESDRKGLRYLEAAGYHGEDFVIIMRKMGQDSWKSGGHIPTYLSTHPGVPERVAYLATTVETRPKSSQGTKKGSENFDAFILMQTKLYGGYEMPAEAATKFREWHERTETKAMAYYGMGLLQRRQRMMAESVDSFRKAINLRPDLVPILVELGETYFQMGDFDKASSVVSSALILEPDQAMALYVLGRTQLEQGKVAEASTNLAKAARVNDRLPSIHYYLGLAYGKLNQLAEAHYQFGIHYRREGSLKNAQFHFMEALRHADSPNRKEAIEKELQQVKGEIKEEQRENSKRR